VLLVATGAVACSSEDPLPASVNEASTSVLNQQSIGVPAYFYPSSPYTLWYQARDAYPAVSVVIANVNSGPGTSPPDSNYVTVIKSLHDQGILVLGYIDSNYGAVPLSTRTAQVDNWYSWYADSNTSDMVYEHNIDGVFVDQVASNPGTTEQSNLASLRDHVKGKLDANNRYWGPRIVVFNPGTEANVSVYDRCDIIMDKETTSYTYTIPSYNTLNTAHHIWHVPRSVTSANLASTVAQTRTNRAGLVMVDDDTSYANLPSYLATEIDRVKPLSRLRAANGTSTTYYNFIHSGSTSNWTTKDVFIDSDNSPTTGESHNGIGADYKVENGSLYTWSGSAWISPQAVTQTTTAVGSNTEVAWSFATSLIGGGSLGTTHKLVFSVSKSGLTQVSDPYTQVFTSTVGTDRFLRTNISNDSNKIYLRTYMDSAYSWKRIYIDDDNTASTGYQVDGIGAGYLIENEKLYVYMGSGTDWRWGDGRDPAGVNIEVAKAALTVTGSGTSVLHEWSIYRRDVDENRLNDDDLLAAFNGQYTAGGTNYYSPLYHHTFTP